MTPPTPPAGARLTDEQIAGNIVSLERLDLEREHDHPRRAGQWLTLRALRELQAHRAAARVSGCRLNAAVTDCAHDDCRVLGGEAVVGRPDVDPAEEVANIECHIRMLLTPEYLASIGADIQAPTHKRELHHRVMRILSDLSERLEPVRGGLSGSDLMAPHDPSSGAAQAPPAAALQRSREGAQK